MTVHKIKQQHKEDNPGVNFMPPSVFYICLITGGVMEFLIPTSFWRISHPICKSLGALMGFAGFIFMMTAHKEFKDLGTNVPTNQGATKFVTDGAYRYSRNPMYVGGSVFFIGIALTVGSIWMLVSYLPLVIYLSCYVIPKEEAYMNRTFKDEYVAYCRTVRRWL